MHLYTPKLNVCHSKKIQEILSEDNIRAKEEVKDFYAQMEELDNETELSKNKIIQIDTENINTISIKSKVIREKDMTLSLAISKKAEVLRTVWKN